MKLRKRKPLTADDLQYLDTCAIVALPRFIDQFLSPASEWDSYDEIAASAYNVAETMLRERNMRRAKARRRA